MTSSKSLVQMFQPKMFETDSMRVVLGPATHRFFIYSRTLCSLNHPVLLTDEGSYVLLMVWLIIPPDAKAVALVKLDMWPRCVDRSWMAKAWMQVSRSPAPVLNSIYYIWDVVYHWIGCHSGCNNSPVLSKIVHVDPHQVIVWVVLSKPCSWMGLWLSIDALCIIMLSFETQSVIDTDIQHEYLFDIWSVCSLVWGSVGVTSLTDQDYSCRKVRITPKNASICMCVYQTMCACVSAWTHVSVGESVPISKKRQQQSAISG